MTQPRTFNLPRKLWVGSYAFHILVVDPSDPRMRTEEDEAAEGMTITEVSPPVILLSSELEGLHLLDIALHEITHAINWVEGIDDGVDEEHLCTRHGTRWAQIYLDNPRFQRWLTYTINKVRKDRSAP